MFTELVYFTYILFNSHSLKKIQPSHFDLVVDNNNNIMQYIANLQRWISSLFICSYQYIWFASGCEVCCDVLWDLTQ